MRIQIDEKDNIIKQINENNENLTIKNTELNDKLINLIENKDNNIENGLKITLKEKLDNIIILNEKVNSMNDNKIQTQVRIKELENEIERLKNELILTNNKYNNLTHDYEQIIIENKQKQVTIEQLNNNCQQLQLQIEEMYEKTKSILSDKESTTLHLNELLEEKLNKIKVLHEQIDKLNKKN